MVLLLCLAAAPVGAIALISVAEEIELGRRLDANVRREVPVLRDARTLAYVRGVASRLVRVAPGPKYPYSFAVADEREINAFALPGGPVWIHRGVLQAATNESQVAGVLAHEIAHIAQRHAADKVTKSSIATIGFGLLGAVLGNSGGAGAAQTAAGVLTNGMFLKFSRDDERDADRVGLQLLMRAGWDGRGMVELFDVIRRAAAREPGLVETFFSSHPAPRDRMAALQAELPRRRAGRRDSQEFRALKARLARRR
jgi:predicted Zn-dependent protease